MFVVVALLFTLQTHSQDYPTSAGNKTELTTGSWVLTNVQTHSYNGKNITKWESATTEINGMCSWKDMLEIIHTVNSGFKWEEPPKNMPIGAFLNIEAKYTNIEYSTPCRVLTGIRMFIDRPGANYQVPNEDAIEIMRVIKDEKSNKSETNKGFFNAPKTLFDDSKQCDLIIDCFIGQDHYVTTYTYAYQP
jgi:hypothetical protein